MCTASWIYRPQGYSLYFNRDERLTRSIAQPPVIVTTDNGAAIMPVDPDGGGTWLTVNSAGWTYALLNYYQGQTPVGALTSRGMIVKQAANCETMEQIEFLFNSLPLKEFAPFSLLCLAPVNLAPNQLAPDHLALANKPPKQQQHKPNAQLWRWTGNTLQRLPASGLITSSSRYFEQTRQARTRLARRLGIVNDNRNRLTDAAQPDAFNGRCTALQHREFHRSHESGSRVTSVCMHREDARTVSLSEINVTREVASYHYFDGSPCEVDTPVSLELPLLHQSLADVKQIPVAHGTGPETQQAVRH